MTLWLENECPEELLRELFDFDPQELARAVAEETLVREGCPYEAEVNLTLVEGERIRELNREMRGIDRETDVLSFPMVEYSVPAAFAEAEQAPADSFDPDSGRLLLGDIVLCAERVRTQAAEYGHSRRREFAFLVAHSMLHLLGYDHMEEEEERDMFRRQEEILAGLGITRELQS